MPELFEEWDKEEAAEYIEHTYYRLGGDLLFKCIVKKDIGDADFQCMMDGVENAREANKIVFNPDG